VKKQHQPQHNLPSSPQLARALDNRASWAELRTTASKAQTSTSPASAGSINHPYRRLPTPPASAPSSPPTPHSLHDELRFPTPIPPPVSTPPQRSDGASSQPLASVASSRPCYRCVAYLRSVGIKRVFWTGVDGAWEGGKVGELVDALEGAGEGVEGGGLAGKGNGVFVTKLEVLMLRRVMGGS